MIIDATRDLSHFDARIGGYAMDFDKPIILVVNKWDLIKKDTMTMKRFEERIRKEFKFLVWAPIVFISAINSQRLDKLKETIIMVEKNIRKQIKTSLLNEMMMDMQLMQPAPTFKGGRLHIKFAKQVPAKIPTFIMFINNKKYLHFSYQRHISKKIRELFGFEGTPLRIVFKSEKKDDKRRR